jgi:hypothetical protein
LALLIALLCPFLHEVDLRPIDFVGTNDSRCILRINGERVLTSPSRLLKRWQLAVVFQGLNDAPLPAVKAAWRLSFFSRIMIIDLDGELLFGCYTGPYTGRSRLSTFAPARKPGCFSAKQSSSIPPTSPHSRLFSSYILVRNSETAGTQLVGSVCDADKMDRPRPQVEKHPADSIP